MEPNKPKYSLDSLAIKSDYYVVKRGGKYHYFRFKIDKEFDGPYFKMTQRPSVILPGIAILQKKTYAVSARDLLRGVVLKSNLVTGLADAGKRSRKSVAGTGTVIHTEQSGSSRDPFMEISEAADLAWEAQTESLLQALYQEEGVEYEVAGTLQSGPVNESGSVSNPNEDSQPGSDT